MELAALVGGPKVSIKILGCGGDGSSKQKDSAGQTDHKGPKSWHHSTCRRKRKIDLK